VGGSVAVNLKYGIIRDHPRLRASQQRKDLAAAGYSPIIELKSGASVETVAHKLRPGDYIGFVRFWVLIDTKTVKRGKRAAAVLATIDAFERPPREAIMHEIATNRFGNDRRQRTGIVADALEDVKRRGQGRRSAENGSKASGRPRKTFTDAHIEQARRAWESRKLKTWAEVGEKLPKGFSLQRAYLMFGKRNSD
jgi:hypothetical protein